MGALAGLLHAAGHEVRGSDTGVYPPMSDQLNALKIPVMKGFSAENLAWGPDFVVVGNVCRKDHVEVIEAQRLEIPLTSLPATLGEQFLKDARSVVVAGTHGKTTTSSLIAHLLAEAGLDPGVFVGGIALNFGRGWRLGRGEFFVTEGDEYDSAFFDKGSKFLHYKPDIAVLTSVELDHVDIFSSMEDVRSTFRKFAKLIPEDGLLVAYARDVEVMAIARDALACSVQTYAVNDGSSEDLDADWIATNVDYTRNGRCRFEVHHQGELYDRYEMMLVGHHNVGNATAAVAVAHTAGIGAADIRRGLAEFAGVARRLEVKGIAQGVYIVDDYAHHPTAVTETLNALRKRFSKRRLMAIFEPRSATSRRRTFQREYTEALAHADAVVVGKPYDSSRIPVEERLDAETLALDLHRRRTWSSYIEDVDAIVTRVMEWVRPGDVVAVLSSGPFDNLVRKLLSALGDAVRPASREDMSSVRKMAAELGWPVDDFGDSVFRNFFVLNNETGVVGCVGLEVYGEAAILRSLSVKRDARGVGYGWLLADTAVTMARLRGVKRIYLLTESASDFFAAKLGFRVIDVSTVSPAVASSNAFRTRLPGAIAMRLDL